MADIQTKPTNRHRIVGAAWLLLVAISTLEVAARIDDWVHFDAPPLGNYDFDRLFRLTDRGIRGVPNGRYLRWRLNSEGLNGPEIRPDAGQARVVIYGASEAFGIYEDTGKEFPRVLEAELNAQTHGSPHEVVNAGIPGMRVGSGITFLRELHDRLRPNAVVIYPTPTHYIGVTRPYCGREPRILTQPETQLPDLRVFGKMKDQIKRSLPIATMTWLRSASIAWQMRGKKPLSRAAPASLKAFEVDLQCAVATVRSLGMVPILATHASRFGGSNSQDDAAWLTGWRQQYPEMREDGFIDLEMRANETIRKVAERNNVALVDAAAVLNGHAEWFADHAHFNNEGAAKMAALLGPSVIEELKNVHTQ